MRGCPGTEAPAPLKVTLLRVQLRWATTSQRKLKHAVQFPAEQCCPEWSLQTCSRRSSFPLQQHIKKWIQTLRDSRYHEPVSKFTVTITRGASQRPGALCSICSPKMWSLNPTCFSWARLNWKDFQRDRRFKKRGASEMCTSHQQPVGEMISLARYVTAFLCGGETSKETAIC